MGGGDGVTGGQAGDAGLAVGGSGAAASGGASHDCDAGFGDPMLVLDEPPNQLSSVSVTADELEIFYLRLDPNTSTSRLAHSRRTSRDAPFPVGEEIPELNASCPNAPLGFIDVSDDGLRCYFSCNRRYDAAAPLWYAERAISMRSRASQSGRVRLLQQPATVLRRKG